MEKIVNHYHHCASCRHFGFQKDDKGHNVPMCNRLGYKTHPAYQFNCWDPKPRVKAALEKKMRQTS
jgi:hypothetical protein